MSIRACACQKARSNENTRNTFVSGYDYEYMYISYLRFVFDGNRIQDADTPDTFDMVDDDAIEVFMQQTGGATTSSRTQTIRGWRRIWR